MLGNVSKGDYCRLGPPSEAGLQLFRRWEDYLFPITVGFSPLCPSAAIRFFVASHRSS